MKVLVADDDAASCLIVRTMVHNLGHECRTSSDGDEAWSAFLSDRPDVVISDWKMPGITGLELCRRVRDHGAAVGSYTYFILVTAQDRQQDIVNGMRSGADDYLVKPLQIDDLDVRLIAASRVSALHRQLSHQRAELIRLNAELASLARMDALTGLGNRLALQEDLATFDAAVDRERRQYCVALLDVDRFKLYNDHYGHIAGDAALRSVAGALRSVARATDSIFRFGGEEFLAVFPDEDLAGAAAAAERMRSSVEMLAIAHQANPPLGIVTLSAGVAMSGHSVEVLSDQILRSADAALYEAKTEGRNRVACSA